MKKLYVSQDDKVILGICGGIAESYGFNANLVRFFFIVSLFVGTAGFWIYLALAFIMPKKDAAQQIIDVEPQTDEEGKKKLIRLWEGRMLGGVCIGIARYFGWDVTLVRVGFVALSFAGWIGVIGYVALWFILPNED
ncbi:MAG: PspC domain-containing protein [Candidatus Cloacimonetes bacterium]|nr:PspC domain-containing protein [Candidatus Cloacimonadota bacterium]MCF7813396.1 PspC domain-containing protein [Candidatus Cloacimonadota bacterium]MCF7867479.1 PspC domain-containing protein [Candidatus Cloacimonadota bacterium]MCF7883018.1 PspC domain-containing protein [Candidatus Cloacimonadota bacterium]